MKKLKNINWNHLFCFHEVAQQKSLKDASKSLRLASSTISEQIKKLEKSLDLKLFLRSKKGLILTKDGTNIANYTKRIFQTGSRMLDSIYISPVGGYSVRVGIVDTISNNVATEFVSKYWDLFSPFGTVGTTRALDFESLRNDLLNGVIDWGIALKECSTRSIDCKKIGSLVIAFCCSKDIYNRFKNPKDIINSIPLARSSWDINLNKIIDLYLKKNDIQPKEYVESDHIEYLHNLCKRGRCVLYVPGGHISDLQTIQVDNPLEMNLYAIWRKEDHKMIFIQKLIELTNMKRYPSRYQDQELQIEVSEVSDELLK